ncbi:MarR family winged helix-turn-helix transcriptional regulator [Actinopolymorpha cephalotaxi]|uniref:DNA-binding MarR family transcriptional regulator n=1 Tax=Actinopolymorpha cephalotaxi TaxID=504797 RepID=A0ABX2RWA6_9ACTN|nr:MarR family winged helix-turn-helix transcriptional regulator [Actinopolymorpha cephalotaxi]NYH81652.1 DNA-binding MarR family transcriptional regulator [Actinopolymorpha cephalotaxi]
MQATGNPAPTGEPGGSPSASGPAPETLLVALMRLVRLVKRGNDAPIEPALHYVLHTVACSGPTRLSDLAGQVQLDVSTVSRHVRALETSGYLGRVTDPDDRRAALVSVTEVGNRVLEEAAARRRARIDAVLSQWPADDVHTLERLLDQLAKDLEAETSTPPGP